LNDFYQLQQLSLEEKAVSVSYKSRVSGSPPPSLQNLATGLTVNECISVAAGGGSIDVKVLVSMVMREVGGNKRLNAGSRGQGTEWVIGRLT